MSLFQFPLPGGRTTPLHPEKSKVLSQLIAACDEAQCEVKRDLNRIDVHVPTREMRYFPFLARSEFSKIFWDRLTFTLNDDGSVAYQGHYGSLAQVALHVIIMLALALEFWAGQAARDIGIARFLGLSLVAHGLPLVLSAIFTFQSQKRILERARERLKR